VLHLIQNFSGIQQEKTVLDSRRTYLKRLQNNISHLSEHWHKEEGEDGKSQCSEHAIGQQGQGFKGYGPAPEACASLSFRLSARGIASQTELPPPYSEKRIQAGAALLR
jgi:hypothetical protein